jgi:DNA ligase (NAD+)
VITALTIRHVGTRIAEILARRFGSIEAIRRASIEELEAVPEVGHVVAASVREFFEDDSQLALLDDLLAAGVAPKPLPELPATDGLPLAGKTLVITGTLPRRSRPEAEALIKRAGGKVTGSVSKSTSYLLAGEEAGSKLEKARQLNIPIIDEAELERLTGGV